MKHLTGKTAHLKEENPKSAKGGKRLNKIGAGLSDTSSQVSKESKKSKEKIHNKKINIPEDDSVLMSDDELLKMYDNKSAKEEEESKKTNKSTKEKSPVQARKKSFTNEPFANQKVVITGIFNCTSDREQLSLLLKNLGASVTGSISGQTTFLMTGHLLEDG